MDQLIVVSGNQSGDLDSIISPIVKTALLRSENQQGTEIRCLLNFPREEWWLRPEADFLLGDAPGLMNSVVFRDEMESLDLISYSRKRALRIILIDHNHPEKELIPYSSFITEIIDHHKDTSPVNPRIKKTIQNAGSCSTLVAEQFLEKVNTDPDLFSKDKIRFLSKILYATIRIDTDHLTNETEYDLNQDRFILNQLKPYNDVDESFIGRLKDMKYDMSHYRISDHLSKDYKGWTSRNISYGISTVLIDINDLLNCRENLLNETSRFMKKTNIEILFLMHFTNNPIIKRELTVIFSHSFECKDEILRAIADSEYFEERIPTGISGLPFSFYAQVNPEYSRKKIQPFINNILMQLKDKK
jgi:inorganic pyrophosphatase/exopolyphosphatase